MISAGKPLSLVAFFYTPKPWSIGQVFAAVQEATPGDALSLYMYTIFRGYVSI